MGNYYEPMQLRASSSAFMWGRLTFTTYKTGCLRKILLQSREVQAPVAKKYGDLGTINEDRHAARLEREGVFYIREAPFKEDIGNGVHLSGHADFVLCGSSYDDMRPKSVDELKSVQSKNVRREVIKKGFYNVENLAQLVCYMSAMDVLEGRLLYTYYEKVGEEWTAMDERIFAVAIDEHYRIFVDLKPTQYTVFDLYAHQKAASEVIAKGTIADRPNNWDAPFVSPCGYCAFKSACDAYDSNAIEGTESFVQQCRNLVSGSDT